MNDRETRALRTRLARAIEGIAPEWAPIFERVPRHSFVSRIIGCWPAREDGMEEGFVLDAERDRRGWLELVYSDRVLVVVKEEEPERFSSSSMPSMMARFLHLLQVEDGNTVLEIGTGTGYHAALLCERLGAERVTSIDIDAELVEVARATLRRCGYEPTLAVADGYHGHAARSPYDHIVATCSVPAVPRAWADQLAPRGVLVAPLENGMLVGLCRRDDGSLVGRADATDANFMPLRSPAWPKEPPWTAFAEPAELGPTVPPEGWMLSREARFHARLHVPDLEIGFSDGDWSLAGPRDGSWARIVAEESNGCVLGQGGPRRLWDLYRAAARGWDEAGRPGLERYGLTVRPDGRQFVWLDDPDAGPRWELPRPQDVGVRVPG